MNSKKQPTNKALLIMLGLGLAVFLLACVYLFVFRKGLNEEGDIKIQTLSEKCIEAGGGWWEEYEECEDVDESWCSLNSGEFNDCESACRHDKKSDVCIDVCIPVCSFKEVNVKDVKAPENFKECVEWGNLVMESYPRKCQDKHGNKYTEYIGNVIELEDKIILNSPRPNDYIESPLIIKGSARGTWFFEASFPVVLVNWDGLIIAEGYASAKSDWMTEEFVEFEAKLEFAKPDYKDNGALILQKDNPSGLPENDNALEIPIYFK